MDVIHYPTTQLSPELIAPLREEALRQGIPLRDYILQVLSRKADELRERGAPASKAEPPALTATTR